MNVIKMLASEEGFRSKPYYCSEGYPTVGIGLRIGPKGAPLAQYEMHMPEAVAKLWLKEYVDTLTAQMHGHPVISAAMNVCGEARQAVLISMAYQMGLAGLAGFHGTLRAITEKRWDDAAAGMLASKWARQTPARAKRHAEQMKTDKWA